MPAVNQPDAAGRRLPAGMWPLDAVGSGVRDGVFVRVGVTVGV